MKKIGEIMSEMGFRNEAPDSVKEAFLKHLIKAAEQVHITTPSEKSEIEKHKIPQIAETLVKPRSENKKTAHESEFGVQLSFDFEAAESKSKVSEVS